MLCLCRTDPFLQPLLSAVEEAPTLVLMILAAWRLARAMAVKIVEEELAQRAQQPTQWPCCPRCGAPLRSKGFVSRQVDSLLGCIRWRRRVGRCPHGCQIGQVAPLDEALGLKPHQHTSGELKQAGCALAVFVPFETVAALLHLLSGIRVSAGAVWLWVQEAGQRAMQRLERELQGLLEGQAPAEEPIEPQTAALPLLIGADGVMVPFRPEEGTPKGKTVWREVKVAILARLGRHTTRAGQEVTRLERRRLVAVLGDIDALAPRLWLEALRQGIGQAKQVAWLSDGARGLWRLFSEHLRQYATGILDFYHAAQNVWKGAAAWLDGRTKRARQWFVLARHRLRHGEADQVLADIAQALELDGLPDSARETLTKLYTYLDKHRDHINYEKFKELGLPIGSGLVESACKWLIQQRFKGVGMRWSDDGFNHLLHLRLSWVNGRFESLFQGEASPNS
ncbi:MAG: ISKra4 family transposase [Deltaproteobacteria bacterium HGW-Deltaproteobacteria-17]|nr:MAG: ISKra4 family transposase [Deltaproteobacteria bacterium HGW-Deltaproteobacteria-17]